MMAAFAFLGELVFKAPGLLTQRLLMISSSSN